MHREKQRERALTVVITDPALRRAVEEAWVAGGGVCRSADPQHDDLFALALASEAIVYAPKPREVGDERLAAALDRECLQAVLGAMNAPGRRRLVIVVEDSGAEEPLREVRKSGVPYVVLRIPPLIESIGMKLRGAPSQRWWLPSDLRKRVVSAAAVAKAIMNELEAADDGVVKEVDGETLSFGEVVKRALDPGEARRLHTLPRPLYRAGVKLRLIRPSGTELIG